jgi:hypothetical protein
MPDWIHHEYTCDKGHLFIVVVDNADGLTSPFITCVLAGCGAEAKDGGQTDLTVKVDVPVK